MIRRLPRRLHVRLVGLLCCAVTHGFILGFWSHAMEIPPLPIALVLMAVAVTIACCEELAEKDKSTSKPKAKGHVNPVEERCDCKGGQDKTKDNHNPDASVVGLSRQVSKKESTDRASGNADSKKCRRPIVSGKEAIHGSGSQGTRERSACETIGIASETRVDIVVRHNALIDAEIYLPNIVNGSIDRRHAGVLRPRKGYRIRWLMSMDILIVGEQVKLFWLSFKFESQIHRSNWR